jgi:hypothetical protein
MIKIITGEPAMNRPFAFEAGIDCLPMYVKRKLDRVALKISRDQWLGMSPEERNVIAQLPAERQDECLVLKKLVCDVLANHGAEPVCLPDTVRRMAQPPANIPAAVSQSAREVGVLLDQAGWSRLTGDQRYALTKLVNSGKKAKRTKALKEFLSGPS